MMDTPFLCADTKGVHPSSIHALCKLMLSIFHFGDDFLHSTKEPQSDLPSPAPPNAEMASSFSWSSLFESPTPRPLGFSETTLAVLSQVKLFCETKFGATKTISIYEPGVHTGGTFLLTSMTKLNQVTTQMFVSKSLLNKLYFLLMKRSSSLLQPKHPVPRPYTHAQEGFYEFPR